MSFTPLNELAKAVHQNAVDKGWWDTDRPFPEVLALIHSEVSEALEEYRDGRKSHEIYYSVGTNGGQKPEGISIELADIIIRVLDYTGSEGIDLDEAIRLKMAYNKTRPHRHGGKLA